MLRAKFLPWTHRIMGFLAVLARFAMCWVVHLRSRTLEWLSVMRSHSQYHPAWACLQVLHSNHPEPLASAITRTTSLSNGRSSTTSGRKGLGAYGFSVLLCPIKCIHLSPIAAIFRDFWHPSTGPDCTEFFLSKYTILVTSERPKDQSSSRSDTQMEGSKCINALPCLAPLLFCLGLAIMTNLRFFSVLNLNYDKRNFMRSHPFQHLVWVDPPLVSLCQDEPSVSDAAWNCDHSEECQMRTAGGRQGLEDLSLRSFHEGNHSLPQQSQVSILSCTDNLTWHRAILALTLAYYAPLQQFCQTHVTFANQLQFLSLALKTEELTVTWNDLVNLWSFCVLTLRFDTCIHRRHHGKDQTKGAHQYEQLNHHAKTLREPAELRRPWRTSRSQGTRDPRLEGSKQSTPSRSTKTYATA